MGVVTVLIPLPLTYNPDADGRRRQIGERKFKQTMEEISKKFGGGILHRYDDDSPRGFWWNKGYLSEDVLALLEVDIPDNPEDRAWIKQYAEDVLVTRFQQQAIYLKIVGPVETMELTARRM